MAFNLTNTSLKDKGLFLKLIENGLKKWIISKCNSVQSLKLEVFGSDLDLFKGIIKEIKLTAKKVTFKGLSFNIVKINTGKIRLNIKVFKKSINIKEKFKIEGEVNFTSKELEDSLLLNELSTLRCWLSKEILEVKELLSFKIDSDKIKLIGLNEDKEKIKTAYFTLLADKGKIIILNEECCINKTLPMDKNIYISEANITKGEIILKGYSNVIP